MLRKKNTRTSKAQFAMYVGYIEKYSILRSGKLTPQTTPEDLQNLWVELKNTLNACGDGPTRDVDGWKKVFTEWKSQIRKKAREGKLLSVIEERCLKATGIIVVEGTTGIPELGVINEVQQVVDTVQNLEVQYVDDQHNVVVIEPSLGAEAAIIESSTPKEVSFEPLLAAEAPSVIAGSSTSKEEILAKDSRKTKGLKKTKKTSRTLLEVYEADQKLQSQSLTGIAKSLQSIADGINRLCDILEKKPN